MTLPDIIMCPFNRFNGTFLRELNISEGLAQYIELTFPETTLSLQDYRPFQGENPSAVLNNTEFYEEELKKLLKRTENGTLAGLLKQVICKELTPLY